MCLWKRNEGEEVRRERGKGGDNGDGDNGDARLAKSMPLMFRLLLFPRKSTRFRFLTLQREASLQGLRCSIKMNS